MNKYYISLFYTDIITYTWHDAEAAVPNVC